MSIKYRDSQGQEFCLAPLAPGGDIEAGVVMTRTGIVTLNEDIAVGYYKNVSTTFDSPMPDADYMVYFDYGNSSGYGKLVNAGSFCIYSKNANGFTLSVAASNSAIQAGWNVKYVAYKVYSVQHAAQNAEDIANILSVIPSNATSANKLATQSDLENVEIDVDDALDSDSENPVQNKVVKAAIDAKQDKVFVGTMAQWNALTLEEKNKYDLVNITDDSETGETVDAVTNGDMRAVTSNAVFDSLSFGRRITASSVAVQGDGVTWTPICDYTEFTGNYIGIIFGFSTARTPIDFPKIMFNTNTNRTSRFPIDINDQCIGRLALRINDNGELEASFYNKGTATGGFVVWAYTHN